LLLLLLSVAIGWPADRRVVVDEKERKERARWGPANASKLSHNIAAT
jgi:hypothetical protein